MRSSRTSGFTLIELLVVIVIIGLLAVAGTTSFLSSQKKGRDARRKGDLQNISRSLELFYNDKGEYPASTGGIITCTDSGGTCDWGTPFSDENGTIYMVELPTDPSEGKNYWYISDKITYQLYARLENTLDSGVPKSGDIPLVYAATECGGSQECNYGISSTNAVLGVTQPE